MIKFKLFALSILFLSLAGPRQSANGIFGKILGGTSSSFFYNDGTLKMNANNEVSSGTLVNTSMFSIPGTLQNISFLQGTSISFNAQGKVTSGTIAQSYFLNTSSGQKMFLSGTALSFNSSGLASTGQQKNEEISDPYSKLGKCTSANRRYSNIPVYCGTAQAGSANNECTLARLSEDAFFGSLKAKKSTIIKFYGSYIGFTGGVDKEYDELEQKQLSNIIGEPYLLTLAQTTELQVWGWWKYITFPAGTTVEFSSHIIKPLTFGHWEAHNIVESATLGGDTYIINQGTYKKGTTLRFVCKCFEGNGIQVGEGHIEVAK